MGTAEGKREKKDASQPTLFSFNPLRLISLPPPFTASGRSPPPGPPSSNLMNELSPSPPFPPDLSFLTSLPPSLVELELLLLLNEGFIVDERVAVAFSLTSVASLEEEARLRGLGREKVGVELV